MNFLTEFMDKDHSLDSLYKQIVKYDESKKQGLETEIMKIAKAELNFDFFLYFTMLPLCTLNL